MRLWVRPRVQIIQLSKFLRVANSAPDTSNEKVLQQQLNNIARQQNFTVHCCQKEKTTLPGTSTHVTGLSYVAFSTSTSWLKNITTAPFCIFSKAIYAEHPHVLKSANPCPIAVHMEPLPPRPSKFKLEYLLLPPRSATRVIWQLLSQFV